MNTCFQNAIPTSWTDTNNSFQQTKRQVNQRYDARTVPDTHRAANIRVELPKGGMKLAWNLADDRVSHILGHQPGFMPVGEDQRQTDLELLLLRRFTSPQSC